MHYTAILHSGSDVVWWSPLRKLHLTKRKQQMEPTEPIMQFFAYEHLPAHLREVSEPFGELAILMTSILPRNPERSVALRKLLEAKDAAVRARLFK